MTECWNVPGATSLSVRSSFLLVFDSSIRVTFDVNPNVFSTISNSGYANNNSTPLAAKYMYMPWSIVKMLLSCISCSVKYTVQLPMVTSKAVLKISARCDSSRSEYIATSPDTSCTMMNSYWYFTAAAHISTMVTCALKAVLESRNTRMNIGVMANGSM